MHKDDFLVVTQGSALSKPASSSVPVRASGEPQNIAEVVKLVERLWAELTVSKRWELFGAGITIDPIIIALRAAAASPSDDGARQPQEQDGHIDWDEERFKRIGKAVREHQRVGQETSDLDFLYRKCSELAAELAAQPAVASDVDEPQSQCPKCHRWQDDLDGFGVLKCQTCDFCAHLSIDGDTCNICGRQPAPLSSPSVAQGWTAQDGFNFDRIEQTVKTIGVLSSNDDARWLVEKLSRIVKATSRIDPAPSVADSPTWQDIATAPKGSWLAGPNDTQHPDYVAPPRLWLLLDDGETCVGYADAYYAEGGSGYDGGSFWVEKFSSERVRPTHWMPVTPSTPAGADGLNEVIR